MANFRKPKLHLSNYSELSCFYGLCASCFYVNLTQVLVTWRGNLNWENAPTWLGCGQACGTFPPLMTGVKWSSSLWVVVLSAMRKQAEQTMDSRPISRLPPWLLHQLLLQVSRLLSWVPDLTSLDKLLAEINSSLLKMHLAMLIVTGTEALTTTACSGYTAGSSGWVSHLGQEDVTHECYVPEDVFMLSSSTMSIIRRVSPVTEAFHIRIPSYWINLTRIIVLT